MFSDKLNLQREQTAGVSLKNNLYNDVFQFSGRLNTIFTF